MSDTHDDDPNATEEDAPGHGVDVGDPAGGSLGDFLTPGFAGPVSGAGLGDLAPHQFDGPLDAWCGWQATNDIGNGRRFQARFGADLIYVRGVAWHGWDGRRWDRERGDDMAHVAAHRTARAVAGEADHIEREDEERAKHLRGWCRECGTRGRVAAMQTEARPYLTRSLDDLDTSPDLLNVANGVLRLGKDVAFLKHNREHRITKMAPAAYDPDADFPVFKEFLATIQPDPALREFLQRYFGYCLTGHISEQVMLIQHGRGANGKSTLTDVLRAVVGDYAAVLPFASLLHDDHRRGSEATPDIARLPGARMVMASEPELGRSFSDAQVKTLTGEGRIAARNLRESFFEFTPQFKLVLSCNNRPTVRGQDEGIWRRMLFMPYEVTVPVDERDKHLGRKLAEEATGILNWIVEGARMWYADGLCVPEAVMAVTRAYREESDPIGQFMQQWVVSGCGPGETISAKALYAAYELWCKEMAMEPRPQRKFGLSMTDRGIPKIKIGVLYYQGVRFTEAANASMAAADAVSGAMGGEY